MSMALVPPHPPNRGRAGSAFLADIRGTLAPGRAGPHGPLPPVLVSMTLVTGLVDAFSYLLLGHVFVANMTGNVVFLGFALAGAPGISIVAALVAIVAFAAGAAIGGRGAVSRAPHRGHLLAAATAIQAALVMAAAVVATVTG